jgi:hypothetical protein
VVLEAIRLYTKATSISVDKLQALTLFREYLRQIGSILATLERSGSKMSSGMGIASAHA